MLPTSKRRNQHASNDQSPCTKCVFVKQKRGKCLHLTCQIYPRRIKCTLGLTNAWNLSCVVIEFNKYVLCEGQILNSLRSVSTRQLRPVILDKVQLLTRLNASQFIGNVQVSNRSCLLNGISRKVDHRKKNSF